MNGMGGMPFMPPMGGMGGNGRDKKERERQTWLSEDEKVWGTDALAGTGVIGRPDEGDEEFDVEELAVPTRPVRTPPPDLRPPRRTDRDTGRAEDGAAGMGDGESGAIAAQQS
jgi:hypothetical protein